MAELKPEPPRTDARPRAQRGASGRRRIATAAQVAVAIVLAVAGGSISTWLAERPGLRQRVDLSADRRNTLDPASAEVVAQLPGEVAIDVFLRAAEPPYTEIGMDVHERIERLLVTARDSAPGKIRVETHDLYGRSAARAENRMRELDIPGVEPFGVLAVSMGRRTTVVHVRGEIADVDPGNPLGKDGPYAPPRLVAFRGEEALVAALLRVAQGDAPKVVFAMGHGERETSAMDERGLARLARELEHDGFQIATWEGERQGPLPDDCAVLCVIGPRQPFTTGESEEIAKYLDSGGRLVAAPTFVDIEGEGSLAALLEPYGIRLEMRGLIARPLATASGQDLVGVPQCAEIIVWSDGMPAATNPVTQSLRRADRRVHLPFTRSIAKVGSVAVPPGVQLLEILLSPDNAWRDLPNAEHELDWKRDENEEGGPFVLATEALFMPKLPVPEARRPAEGVRPESRILCVGSADAFANALSDTNRDFLLNAFNWASSREFRVHVAHKARAARRIDVTSGNALARVNLVSFLLLPALCLMLGAWTAWKRRH